MLINQDSGRAEKFAISCDKSRIPYYQFWLLEAEDRIRKRDCIVAPYGKYLWKINFDPELKSRGPSNSDYLSKQGTIRIPLGPQAALDAWTDIHFSPETEKLKSSVR